MRTSASSRCVGTSIRWIGVSACKLAVAAAVLIGPRVTQGETFDLHFYRYCAPGTLCGFASEQAYQDRICDAVQDMNTRWEVTGISFRPTALPIDDSSPADPPPGASPDKDKYYESSGCRNTDEDALLRVHWRDNVAAADPLAISMMLAPQQNRCCSNIARPSKVSGTMYGIFCDARRNVLATGSLWAHEMGHHWGLVHTHRRCQDLADTAPNLPFNDNDSSDQDLSGPVNDTPADPCKFEICKRVCSGDSSQGCTTNANCAGVGTCVCKAGADENFNGNLVNDHQWIASIGSERTVDPIIGATDDGSPNDTYCSVVVKERVAGVTGVSGANASIVNRNAMSYHSASCRGPYVLNGIRFEALTVDQRARIQAVRTQISIRNDLPDVCAGRGADLDYDGICGIDDNCPHDKNTCQRDADSDGDGDACDLCPFDPNPTGDIDEDGIGDICDPDRDGDGCCDPDKPGCPSAENPFPDQHPDQANVPVGSAFNASCGFGTETVYGFEGLDSDDDGFPNCADPDDDNDGICDEAESFAPGTPGAADGCEAGPDLCPIDEGEIACHLQGAPVLCPPPWLACLMGGCLEFFVKFVSIVNPDPTTDVIFDSFQIVNHSLFLSPQQGMTPSEGAIAIQGAPAGGAATIVGPVRMEIWSREENRRVAIVGEFESANILFRNITQGTFLALTPMMNETGAPMLKGGATYSIGVLPGDMVPDGDSDLRPNAFDNCIAAANPVQTDADGDGFGNACDADLDGDLIVTQADVDAVQACEGADLSVEAPILEPEEDDTGEPLGQPQDPGDEEAVALADACRSADLNDDGMVDEIDTAMAMIALGSPPGPSALALNPPGPHIVVGTVVGAAGLSVDVPVTLQTGGLPVAGAQNDISFLPDTPIAANADGRPACAVNSAINKPGSAFSFQPPGCTPGTDCTGIRAIIVDVMDTSLIPDGAELYRCTADVAAGAQQTSYPLICSLPEAGDPDGGFLAATCQNGAIQVRPPPTPCTGDCNGDGRVIVNELIFGVNVSLGRQLISDCARFDGNEDGMVTINELITAVNNAMNGCPA